jgi:hypothetical protein
VDPTAARFWELPWCTFAAPTVHEMDPLVVAVDLDGDDGRLRVLVDEDVAVRSLEG